MIKALISSYTVDINQGDHGYTYLGRSIPTAPENSVAISDQALSSTQRSKSFCGHCLDIVSTSMTFAKARSG